MLAYERMQQIAATTSRNDKEQLLFDAFAAGEWEFFSGCRLGLNPLCTFGVKKVAQIVDDDGLGDYSFAEFTRLADQLSTRQLTGHAARDAIHAAAARCHASSWNHFYRRILLKDLNIGVDDGTLNKVLKKLMPTHADAQRFLVPVFKCQLAQDGEDVQHQKKLRGRRLVDTKLDGVRILAMMDTHAGIVSLFSRNGQLIEGFPELYAVLRSVLTKLPGPVMLDGELISPKGFQHLMTLIKRKDVHPDTALIRYALFDLIPLEDFRNGRSAKPQRERRTALEALHMSGYFIDPEQLAKRLYVVPQIECDLDTADGQAAFAEFNRQAITDGFEGIMVKDPDAPYVGKRTDAWLKKKPTIEVTLEVVGVEPGKPDGKYANTLGALVCRGTDNGLAIGSNVSGGLTDAQRDQLWAERDSLLGMLVEVVADKITLEDGADVWSLRFPRVKGFRGRYPGEKL